jgi:hypothetical protein
MAIGDTARRKSGARGSGEIIGAAASRGTRLRTRGSSGQRNLLARRAIVDWTVVQCVHATFRIHRAILTGYHSRRFGISFGTISAAFSERLSGAGVETHVFSCTCNSAHIAS